MTELSPAAQAVYDGFWRGQGYFEGDELGACFAAALHAAADQVVPGDGSRRANEIRAEFLAIADELEAL